MDERYKSMKGHGKFIKKAIIEMLSDVIAETTPKVWCLDAERYNWMDKEGKVREATEEDVTEEYRNLDEEGYRYTSNQVEFLNRLYKGKEYATYGSGKGKNCTTYWLRLEEKYQGFKMGYFMLGDCDGEDNFLPDDCRRRVDLDFKLDAYLYKVIGETKLEDMFNKIIKTVR